MSDLTVEFDVHIKTGKTGRKRMRTGKAPTPPEVPPGRIPRLSRLMALAIRFENLVEEGHVRDYADLARLGHVTRARITQIMNLLHLAPNIQEDLLFLPLTTAGRDPISERPLRPIAAQPDWQAQRQVWNNLQSELCQ